MDLLEVVLHAMCSVSVHCALKQHEDTCSKEIIVSELKRCIEQLRDKIKNVHCFSDDDEVVLNTCLYLGDIMLKTRPLPSLTYTSIIAIYQLGQFPCHAITYLCW